MNRSHDVRELIIVNKTDVLAYHMLASCIWICMTFVNFIKFSQKETFSVFPVFIAEKKF